MEKRCRPLEGSVWPKRKREVLVNGEWWEEQWEESWKEKVNGLKRDERKKYRHFYKVGSSCAHSRVFLCKGRGKIEWKEAAGGDFCAVQPNLMQPCQNFRAMCCWPIFAHRLGPLGHRRDAARRWLMLTVHKGHCMSLTNNWLAD